MKIKLDFRLIRILAYVGLFTAFIIIPTERIIAGGSTCLSAGGIGILCPGCGVTRAFSSICHGNISDAFMFNGVFTAAMLPTTGIRSLWPRARTFSTVNPFCSLV